MISIRSLSECTWNEVVDVWNKGFEGYFVPVSMDVEKFTNRLVMEGLSPSLSIVAFDGDTPVGILLNGIRTIREKKISWNGGTAVVPAYRKKGVGEAMMRHVLHLYEEEGVNVATLEAISENDKAISLYKKLGYEVIDHLHSCVQKGRIPEVWLQEAPAFDIQHMHPQQLQIIPFYKTMSSWQTQCFHIKDGEAIVAVDSLGEQVGYCFFKRLFAEEGKVISVVLYQCVIAPNRQDEEAIAQILLKQVLEPQQEYERTAVNIASSNEVVLSLLEEAGFEVRARQVHMIKEMR